MAVAAADEAVVAVDAVVSVALMVELDVVDMLAALVTLVLIKEALRVTILTPMEALLDTTNVALFLLPAIIRLRLTVVLCIALLLLEETGLLLEVAVDLLLDGSLDVVALEVPTAPVLVDAVTVVLLVVAVVDAVAWLLALFAIAFRLTATWVKTNNRNLSKKALSTRMKLITWMATSITWPKMLIGPMNSLVVPRMKPMTITATTESILTLE